MYTGTITLSDTLTATVQKKETENGRKAKLKTRHPTPNNSVEKKDLYTVNQHDVMTPSHA